MLSLLCSPKLVSLELVNNTLFLLDFCGDSDGGLGKPKNSSLGFSIRFLRDTIFAFHMFFWSLDFLMENDSTKIQTLGDVKCKNM